MNDAVYVVIYVDENGDEVLATAQVKTPSETYLKSMITSDYEELKKMVKATQKADVKFKVYCYKNRTELHIPET